MPLFRNFGVPELILVLVLALIIFGPGRVARLGSELGKGIRGFKEGLQPTKPKEETEKTESDSSSDEA
ncbi:MAG TPA: twin-arginine translocase TatA/TatE family subunit [Anaerolineae bacterium]|nr:twin-arginine translocase TatA/TatE family subunit [Anaerolineae bacterium]HQI86680.1 twin-arginine translocase TatA/TatE family subunit [Anaerolineae bacterium]HQK13430.1 twin-arginine translocase TatA/TatE family subunit [Anaerolineae bacterium]